MTEKNIKRMPEGDPIVSENMPEGGEVANVRAAYLSDDLNDMSKFTWQGYNNAVTVNDPMLDIRYAVTITSIHPMGFDHTEKFWCRSFYEVVKALAWHESVQGNRIKTVNIEFEAKNKKGV